MLHSNIWNNLTECKQTIKLEDDFFALERDTWIHLSECKNWIISFTLQYLQPFHKWMNSAE